MFFLSKLIDHFLLPPGLFFVIAAVLVFLHKKRKFRAVSILLPVLCASLYLFSIEPVRDLLISPLENRYLPAAAAELQDAAAVVCLGGGIQPFSPDENGMGTPSLSSLKRLIYTFRIAEKSGLPVITAGGVPSGKGRNQSEAEVMKTLLQELGLPEQRIFTEEESRNTWENALNISRLYGTDRVVLVTSAFHMPRSVRCFREHGIQAVPAPSDYRSARGSYTLRSFFPSMAALRDVHAALKEYTGICYYALRFWR